MIYKNSTLKETTSNSPKVAKT